MQFPRLFPLFLSAAMLGGCASAPLPPAAYNAEDSFALNVMKAAGMSSNLKDQEVPADTITQLRNSAGYGLAQAGLGYATPIPGFTGGQMAGMNAAAWLFAPTALTARNSLFAWMPESTSRGAPVSDLIHLMEKASTLAAEEMGYRVRVSYMQERTVAVVLMTRDDEFCRVEGQCAFSYGIREPEDQVEAASFVGLAGPSYFFDPAKRSPNFSLFTFTKAWSGINELEMLVRISKHMPDWFYFYVAPKQVQMSIDERVRVPMLVNRGELNFFVRAAS